MTAVKFDGHIRAMRADSAYFGAEDFVGDQDIPLRVEGVFYDDSLKIGGGKAKPAYYLTLSNAAGKPCKKRMLLNASRRKALAAMYGGIAADWSGKWVWVYTDKVKNPAGGDDVLGMKFRIRTTAPRTANELKAAPIEQQSDPLADYRDKLSRAATEQEARDVYERCGNPDVSGWTLDQDKQAAAMLAERIREINGGAK